MSKLSDARDFVQTYGELYGWSWDKTSGLKYQRIDSKNPYIDWQLASDAEGGNWVAENLINAINTISVKEVNDAIHNINRRVRFSSDITDQYEVRAKELLLKQRERLREADSPTAKVMMAQNIHRASDVNEEGNIVAFRQTPRERASQKGVKEREVRSFLQMAKTFANTQRLSEYGITLDDMSEMSDILKSFGIPFPSIEDEIERRIAKIQSGDYSLDPEAEHYEFGQYFYKLTHDVYETYDGKLKAIQNAINNEPNLALEERNIDTIIDKLGAHQNLFNRIKDILAE